MVLRLDGLLDNNVDRQRAHNKRVERLARK